MKGVILAAGYGTRLLPVTKTVPKELLPLVDTPAIQWIVDEFLQSGIGEILIVTNRRKKALEDYFDREVEVETHLEGKRREDLLAKLSPPKATISFVRQKEMRGTADALLCCERFVSGNPFVVAHPDDVVLSRSPLTKTLIEAHRETGRTVLSLYECEPEELDQMGVVDGDFGEDPIRVREIVEKPGARDAPSRYAVLGRYLFTPEIFPAIRAAWDDAPEPEVAQPVAINRLAEKGRVVAKVCEGERLDVGKPLGYLKAITSVALTRPDLAGPFREYLKSVL
ncbi:MAG: UTP--glucose-1-phosphate uridylyltransferase [Nitrospinota bacterium]